MNINDESRKRFEISARAVFKKFKACLTFKGVDVFRSDYQAISFIYKILKDDREKADTSEIIKKLNEIVSKAINVENTVEGEQKIFDISKIDFDLLHEEFKKSDQKILPFRLLKKLLKKVNKNDAGKPLRQTFKSI